MSDGEQEIAPAAGTSEGGGSGGSEDASIKLRNKRKQLRGKVTHMINRVWKFIAEKDQTKRRIEKELEELWKDFHLVRDVYPELYYYVDPSQIPKLDKWENELTDDVFGIEEQWKRILDHWKILVVVINKTTFPDPSQLSMKRL